MSFRKLYHFACVLLVAGLATGCGPESSPETPVERAIPPPSEPKQLPAAETAGAPPDEIRDAILEVLQEPDAFQRAERLAQLLPELGAEGGERAHSILTDNTLDLGAVEAVLLLRQWSLVDPETAARWALFRNKTPWKSGMVGPAIALWTVQDPMAAAAASQEFGKIAGAGAESVERALVRSWFESGQPGLDAYIQNLAVGISRQRALAARARAAIKRDGPEAAIAWAEALPDEDRKYKLSAFRQTGSELGMLTPQIAADWCDRVCPGPFGASVRTLVAQRWAFRDGESAMAWVSQAPPGRDRDWAVKGALRGWMRSDREGLERWAQTLLPEVAPWFQPAIEILASSLVRTSRPEEALDWVDRIEDPTTRERTVINVARLWRRDDAGAADAWLANASLSEESLDRIRNPEAYRQMPQPPEPDPAG